MNNAQTQQAQQPYITIEEGQRYWDARAVMFTLYNHGEKVGSYTACILSGRCVYHCWLIGEDGDLEAFCEVHSHSEMMRRLSEHFTPTRQDVTKITSSDAALMGPRFLASWSGCGGFRRFSIRGLVDGYPDLCVVERVRALAIGESVTFHDPLDGEDLLVLRTA